MKILKILVLSLPIFSACEIDHGLSPTIYAIKGKVILIDKLPPNTERIDVVVAKEFPPEEFMELERSGALAITGDTLHYEVQVSSSGIYAAVAVVWKGRGLPWSITDILGFYTSFETFPLPQSVEVTEDLPVVEGIDIYAQPANVIKDAMIKGKIYYHGQWPKDTEIVATAAFFNEPKTDLEYITQLGGINYSLPMNVDSCTYQMALKKGTYRYIVLFWKQRGSALTDFKPIGYYKESNESNLPDILTVAPGDTLENINIYADFNMIKL